MGNTTLGMGLLNELESEARASRKCLERIPESLFTWKPHAKSMNMGYLALLVAEIPRWITNIIEISVIDFANYKTAEAKSSADLVNIFEVNLEGAEAALTKVQDSALSELFYLKNNGAILMSSPKIESISSSINHLVHHRGQLTVYMRLNDIPVPSIYGPSADDNSF